MRQAALFGGREEFRDEAGEGRSGEGFAGAGGRGEEAVEAGEVEDIGSDADGMGEGFERHVCGVGGFMRMPSSWVVVG